MYVHSMDELQCIAVMNEQAPWCGCTASGEEEKEEEEKEKEKKKEEEMA